MSEPQGRTAEVGGTSIHYHDVGQGPVVMLLHGGGPGASGWSNFSQNVPALSRHFRLLVVDQPGYGRSGKVLPPDGEARSQFGARCLLELLDQLGIDQAHLIGNSLGGRTALTMALDAPGRVGRLLLMGPGGGSLSLFGPEPSEGMKVLHNFYKAPGPSVEKMQQLINVMMYDPSQAPVGLAEARFAAATAPEVAEFYQHYFTVPGVREPELWRELELVEHETLVVWGRDDRTLPLDGAFILLKRMPNARLHVFPRCGHWAQVEWRDEFDRLAIDFLGVE